LNLWDIINVDLINPIINLKMRCKIEVQISYLFKDSVLIFWMKRNFVLLVKDGMTKTGSSYLVFIYAWFSSALSNGGHICRPLSFSHMRCTRAHYH